MQQDRVFSMATSLQEAKRRFARWRRSRHGQGRIPSELWIIAAKAAAGHGIDETACQLGLNRPRLKHWVHVLGCVGVEGAGREGEAASGGAQFLELPPLGLASGGECTIELEDKSGRKVRILLKGPATREAVALGRMLWRGET